MGSGTIRFWLFTVIIIAAAGRILGADSPKVPTDVAYVSEEDGGISEIDLSTLKVIRRVEPSDLSPQGHHGSQCWRIQVAHQESSGIQALGQAAAETQTVSPAIRAGFHCGGRLVRPSHFSYQSECGDQRAHERH